MRTGIMTMTLAVNFLMRWSGQEGGSYISGFFRKLGESKWVGFQRLAPAASDAAPRARMVRLPVLQNCLGRSRMGSLPP